MNLVVRGADAPRQFRPLGLGAELVWTIPLSLGLGAAVTIEPLLVLAAVAAVGVIAAALSAPFLTFCGLGVVVVFQPLLLAVASVLIGREPPLLKNVDELLIVLVATTFVVAGRLRVGSLLLPSLTGLVVVGVVSAALQGASPGPTALGAFLMVKVFLLFVIGYSVRATPKDLRLAVALLAALAGIMVLSIGFDYLAPGVQERLYPGSAQFRLGLKAAQGILNHPGALQQFLGFVALLFLGIYTMTRRRQFLAFVPVLLLGALMTLRLRPLLFIPAAVVIAATVIPRMGHRRGRFRSGVLIVVASVFVVTGMATGILPTILGDKTTDVGSRPRTMLTKAAVRIAVDNAPLGTGFGTFGGYVSRANYSRVYEEYGLSSQYGLGASTGDFLSDTHWPYVLGETGFAGLAFYLAALFAVFGKLRDVMRVRNDPLVIGLALGAAMCLVEALLEGFASPVLQGSLNGYMTLGIAGLVMGTSDARQPASQDPIATQHHGGAAGAEREH